MIEREKLALVRWHLRELDSVALLGARQVGKTTLARKIAEQFEEDAVCLDLENPDDRQRLDDPVRFFNANSERLVVLDEIQKMPNIFEVLRGQIDAQRRSGSKGRFLILGSASIDLLQQSSESLAGRISFIELGPLTLTELIRDADAGPGSLTSEVPVPGAEIADIAEIRQSTEVSDGTLVDRLWLKGGFPRSYRAERDLASHRWRINFIKTYLERDLPSFGIRVGAEQLGRFWRLLASDQGSIFVAERYAGDLGVKGHSIARYLEVLKLLLLVRELRPWAVNGRKRLVKKPKVYIRDSGILHALLNIRTLDSVRAHDIAGASWEGFVIEALIDAAGDHAEPFFYRTQAGAEIDLILEFSPGRVWAIEIKLSNKPRVSRRFDAAADDVGAERRLVISGGSERYFMRERIEIMPLLDAIREIQAVGEVADGQ